MRAENLVEVPPILILIPVSTISFPLSPSGIPHQGEGKRGLQQKTSKLLTKIESTLLYHSNIHIICMYIAGCRWN